MTDLTKKPGATIKDSKTTRVSSKTVATEQTILSTITTPANPSSGEVKVYAKSDGQLYVLDSNGSETQVGSGGGGGGITPSLRTTGFTAASGFHYLCDTTGGAFTATLPAGTTGAVIKFSDVAEKWDVANLTITPASGEVIDNLAANESLVCDVVRGWVELSWTGTKWGLVSMASTTVSSVNVSGVKNYFTSPNTSTGWVASGAGVAIATDSTPANLPSNVTQTSALRITRASGSDYARYRFTLDQADYNKKLQISWDQRYTGTSGDYTVKVFSNTASDYSGTSTELPVSTSNIQPFTGTFSTVFDSSGSTAPYLEIRITGVSGTTALYLSNMIVGPGLLVQGPIITEWQSYTTTVSTGTWTTTRAYYRRVGSSMELNIYAGPLTADGSGVYSWTLPSGLTADLAALGASGVTPALVDTDSGSNTLLQVGVAMFGVQGGVFYSDGISGSLSNPRAVLASTTSVAIVTASTTNAGRANVLGSANTLSGTTTTTIQIQARIPIAEWSGNGTVTLGQGAQVEYAYNSSTATAANDTSSFAFGPQGALIQNITAALSRRVRFQYAIQADDVVEIEVSDDRIKWYPLTSIYTGNAGASVSSWQLQGTTSYGFGRVQPVAGSSTDVDVFFGTYALTTNTTYNTAGTAWSSGAGSYYWRVRKAKAGSLVGVQAATNDTYGLIKLSQLSGAGEKNYLSTGTSDSSGWTASGAGVSIGTETSAANLPENVTKTTALRVTRASGSDYAYYRFTLDASDYSRKLKIQWYQRYAGSTGDYTISVFSNTASNYGGTSTALTVSSPSVPSLVGFNTVTFDAPGSAAPYIEVRINGIAGTTALYLSSIVVGPGTISQGAAISEWQSYTPVVSNLGGGSISSIGARWRRVGSSMQVMAGFVTTGTGSGASNVTVSLPSGFTVDINALPVNSYLNGRNKLGSYTRYNGAAYVDDSGVIPGSSTTVCFIEPGTASTLTGADFPASTELSFDVMIPIAEWAGNGTISLGQGAQVEYASNDASAGGSANTQYTTGSVPGPQGSLFLGVASTTVTGGEATDYVVNFQYPIQSSDVMMIETLWPGNTEWVPIDVMGGVVCPLTRLSNGLYGMGIVPRNSTSIFVRFGNGGRLPTGGYGAAGSAWSGITTYRWRVRKVSASTPTGFGAATQTDQGLITLSQLKSDELNAIAYPSDARGWSASGAGITVATTYLASELPLAGIIASGIKITNVSGTDEVRYDFDMPLALMNRKLKIQWEQIVEAAYGSTDTTVDIKSYTDSARTTSETVYNLSTDSSGATYVPATSGRFLTTFDADSRVYYRLVLRRAAGTKYVVLANVIVGPGQVAQGAAVSDWQNYSSPTTLGFGTVTSDSLKYIRIGSSLRMVGRFTTGTVDGSAARITLPLGLTVGDTGSGAPRQVLGAWWHNVTTASNPKRGVIGAVSGDSFVSFCLDDYTSATSPFATLAGNQITGNSTVLGVDFTIPISQWAGGGTLTLGAGAQVEYASNNGSAGTTANTNYTTGTVYGPNGSAFADVAISGVSATTVTGYDVVWQTPIQTDDVVVVEISPGGSGWVPLGQASSSIDSTRHGSVFCGMFIQQQSANTTRVFFSNAGRTSSATYGQMSGNWGSDITSWRWRLRKSKASSPVGFGLAGADGSSGLVNPYTVGSGVVYSGIYTPTITNISGVSAITARQAQYSRVGRVVTVSGLFLATFADSVDCALTVSLPINRASNFGVSLEGAAGAAVANRGGGATSNFPLYVCGRNGSNSTVEMGFSAGLIDNNSHLCTYTFSYTLD